MARNVGKTRMEENLSKTLSRHQGRIMLVLGGLVVALLIWSSRDWFAEYSGVVGEIGTEDHNFTVHKRTKRSLIVTCAILRYDGDSETTEVCNEDPSVFSKLKPRHRFVKPRFRQFMEAVGGEIEVPWLKEAPPTPAAPPAVPAAPTPPPAQ
jgi:hypothetical protein